MNNIDIYNVKGRVKDFCKILNITIVQFEKSINVSNGYVNSISRNIGIDKLALIVEKYPNLNIEWLLLGKGSATKDGQNIAINQDIKDNSNNIKGHNNIIDQHKSESTETTHILKQIINDKDKVIATLTEELKEKSQQITTLLNIINK